jgi:DNA (cytosine-5)-methyltransferase 1
MINGISLFSNIGISEQYLKDVDINIVAANELLEERAKIYSFYHPESEMVCGDILDPVIFNKLVDLYNKNDCKFLIATPPCQGMSLTGPMDPQDIRNRLIIPLIEFVKEVQPDNILIENVPQVFNTYIIINNKPILINHYITKELAPLGYIINPTILNAKDYGTPQNRKRAIILISKLGLWDKPQKQPIITVRDSISDLPSIEAGEDSGIQYHKMKPINQEHITWMQHTPSGKSAHENPYPYYPNKDGRRIKGFRSRYGRISWDKPCPTILTSNYSISINMYHPGRPIGDGLYSDARLLTLLEILRLSGLPDKWPIPDFVNEDKIREVLGEQFPPRFAEALISTIPPQEKGQQMLF